jgi:hypothetical protein
MSDSTPQLKVNMISIQNQRYGVVAFSLLMSACSSLLPSTRQINDLPWNSYQQAQEVFALITPTQTKLGDLQRMGIDPEKTPNVTLLNHADVTRRLVAISTLEISFLPPLVQQCLASYTECFALQIEQKHVDRKRYGNFWLDFLTFNRKVEISGWQFEALIIMQKDLVVYKLWTGKPTILQLEEERNPLGPLQGAGSSILKR